jgi:hypothetical protein
MLRRRRPDRALFSRPHSLRYGPVRKVTQDHPHLQRGRPLAVEQLLPAGITSWESVTAADIQSLG